MITVGITATRCGLTGQQADTLSRILGGCWGWDVSAIHHGDCLGGDADADAIAAALGIRRVSHPPTNDVLRAHCAAEHVMIAEPYLTRNRAIVLATFPLIALPAYAVEAQHGGTWSTVHYARNIGRALTLVFPDGSTVHERYDPLRL